MDRTGYFSVSITRSSFSLFRYLLLISLLSCLAWAQSTTGALSGTVTDPAGAVVVGAKVEVINEATGVVTPLTTNDVGVYRAAFLNPGTYTVRVQAPGFSTFESKGVLVELAHEPVVNAALTVGQVGQTVEVQSTAALLVTDTAQLSTNVPAQSVVTLPGLQGAMDRMALTSPGVVYGFGNINSNGLVFSANGQRARSNNFLLDGQDNNDPSLAGPGYSFSNLEAVGEFQVITNQYSAEYGRNAGAIVNIRVKSGTNEFHGVGTYLRRDDQNWTALDNIQRASGLTNPPKYLDTVLGGQFGGPIIKDKLFFNIWTQREWIRSNSTFIGTGSTLMPTPAGLQELQTYFPSSPTVADLVKYGAYGITLGNPHPVGNVLMQSVTTPTGAAISVPFSSVERSVSTPGDNWDSGVHVDYSLTDKMQLTGKFYDQINSTPYSSSNGQAGYFIGTPSHSKQAGGSWVWTISPTLVNEFRFSFVKSEFDDFGGNTASFANLTQNIANVAITGYLGYGLAYNLPQYRLVNSYQYQDNVSKQLGRHALKFGVQYIDDNTPLGFLPYGNGVYAFSSFQQYLNDTPTSFTGAAGITTEKPHELDQAYYIQDDFRFHPNLTFNLGLRYEYSGQPLNILNQETVARESNPATAIWNTALPLAARTYPKLPAPSLNFAPRIGMAYTPAFDNGILGKLFGHDETVIRAGFSIAYDPSFYNLLLNAATAAPVVFAYTLTGSSLTPMPANITGSNLQTLYAPPKGVDPRTLNQTLFAPNFRDPYSESYTFGIQRRIGANMGFEIRYVGTQGVDLFATRDGNPYIAGYVNDGFANAIPAGLTPTVNPTCAACNGRLIPNYGVIRIRDNSGHSSYNGLQTSYNIRDLGHQLTLGAAFTWSKTMDNMSEVYTFLSSGSVVLAQDPFNTGPGERALSNNNIPEALSLNATWTMPWLKGTSHWYGRVAGGWKVGIFEVAQAGRPMTPVQNNTNANPLEDTATESFVGGGSALRPFLATSSAPMNSVGEYLANGSLVNLANTSQPVSFSNVHWIYNNLYSDRVFDTPFGVGRNVLTGPLFQRVDISVFKDFAIRERLRLELRADATNAFNHPSYNIPNLYVDVSTATTFLNPTSTEVTPRIIKLGAKIIF